MPDHVGGSPDGPRRPPGGSAAQSAPGVQRAAGGTNQRPTRGNQRGILSPGYSLCLADASKKSRIYFRRRPDAGARDWRQHRDFQRRVFCPAAAASLQSFGAIGPDLVEISETRGSTRTRFRPVAARDPAAQPLAAGCRSNLDGQRYFHRRRESGAGEGRVCYAEFSSSIGIATRARTRFPARRRISRRPAGSPSQSRPLAATLRRRPWDSRTRRHVPR